MSRILGISISRRLPRRTLTLVVFTTFIFLFIFIISSQSIDNDEEWYKHPEVFFSEIACEHDEFTRVQFTELTSKLKQMLEHLGVTYFLCYGSLWGAIKFERTLPWDRNIDMCVIYNEWVSLSEEKVHEAFKQADLDYSYNSRRGKYVITYKTVSAEITLFEKVGNHMERVGWEKRIFPHLYLGYQNFPFQLVDKKLPKLKFNGIEINTPHQDYELQKYLYPENWWKEIKPRGCV